MRDGVGLVAGFGHGQAARLVGAGLRALRTRGGDASGVAAPVAGRARREAGVAWLDDGPALDAIGGPVAVGATLALGAAPLDRDRAVGLLDPPAVPAAGVVGDAVVAVAVAGALVDPVDGVAAETPSEALLALLQRSSQRTLVNRLVDALWSLRGGFAGVVAAGDRLIGIRDAAGVKPLVIGRAGASWWLASDTRALAAVGAGLVRAVEPGEVVVIDAGGLLSVRPLRARPAASCVFEAVALGAPADPFAGRDADAVRRALGAELEPPLGCEVITAAGPGGGPAAVAWAEASGRRYEPLLADGASPRAAGRGVGVIVSDDGVADAGGRLLAAGAREVVARRLAPAPVHPCPYGVLTRRGAVEGEGVALERLRRVAGAGVCDGCLSGSYPVVAEAREEQLPLFRRP